MDNTVVTGSLVSGEIPWGREFRWALKEARVKIGDTLHITVDEDTQTYRVEIERGASK